MNKNKKWWKSTEEKPFFFLKKKTKNIERDSFEKIRKSFLKERERYKAIKLIKQVFVRKNAFLSGNFVFVRFFLWWKLCEREFFLTQELIFTTCGKQEKRRIEICFVFWTNNKNENPKKRFQQYRAQTKSFFTRKRRYCVPIFQRCFLHCEKWT